MKCNINRTINNNNMARVYGPEFNFSTEEIINIIRKVSKLKVGDRNCYQIEFEATLYNCDYYVRPGIAKEQFMNEVKNALDETCHHPGKMDYEEYCRFLARAFYIIQKFFDEAYFEEQLTTITANKDKLKMYLKKLDRYQLEIFFNIVMCYKFKRGLFVTDASLSGLGKKIHKVYTEAGFNIPKNPVSADGLRFFKENDCIKVFGPQVFVNALCDAIDLDIETASSAAKKLYTSGRDAMINYIRCKTGVEL